MAGASAAPVQLRGEDLPAARSTAFDDADFLPPLAEQRRMSAMAAAKAAASERDDAEVNSSETRKQDPADLTGADMAAANLDEVLHSPTTPTRALAEQSIVVPVTPRAEPSSSASHARRDQPSTVEAEGAMAALQRRIIRRPSTCVSEPDVSRFGAVVRALASHRHALCNTIISLPT